MHLMWSDLGLYCLALAQLPGFEGFVSFAKLKHFQGLYHPLLPTLFLLPSWNSKVMSNSRMPSCLT